MREKQQKELQRRAAEKAAKAAKVEAANALLARRLPHRALEPSEKAARTAAGRLLCACEKGSRYSDLPGRGSAEVQQGIGLQERGEDVLVHSLNSTKV